MKYEDVIRRTKCDTCRKYDEKYMTRIIREPTQTEIERELRQRRIDEIQRAAHAAGMSYGRYVAMMEMQKGA